MINSAGFYVKISIYKFSTQRRLPIFSILTLFTLLKIAFPTFFNTEDILKQQGTSGIGKTESIEEKGREFLLLSSR